ncbi:MAG: N-acetylneuraminate synthase family protein [Phycisphaerales bacterium]
MRIGEREIGPGHPPYVIAEIGVNHDGEVTRALELTDAAADAGADAVKLQYFETDRLMSKAAKLAAYQKAAGETDPVAMLRRLELSLDEMAMVVERAHERGVHAIVTVFSVELVEAASRLRWDAFKTASPDLIHLPLLLAMRETGRPLIVSTGASDLAEVEKTAGWLKHMRKNLAFLQCVSCYPAPTPALEGIPAIARAVKLPTGYSDHTPGIETGGLAVRAGACILEKHLTYDSAAKGPDHSASLEPDALTEYILCALDADFGADNDAIAPFKSVLDCERDVQGVARQGMVTTRAVAKGERVEIADLTLKRGGGIPPEYFGDFISTVAQRDIPEDDPVWWGDLI